MRNAVNIISEILQVTNYTLPTDINNYVRTTVTSLIINLLKIINIYWIIMHLSEFPSVQRRNERTMYSYLWLLSGGRQSDYSRFEVPIVLLPLL